jgi:hypothetical protein
MAEPTFLVILSTLTSCVGIFAAALMFRSYQIDNFREKIFTLRDEVFLYSYDQGLVDHCSHRNFRDLLNCLLRYAEKVTFAHMVTLLLAKRILNISSELDADPMAEWESAVSHLAQDQQTKFYAFNKRAIGLVVKHIIVRSAFFWLFAALVVISRVFNGQMAASTSVVKNAVRSLVPVQLLEAEALRTGRGSP